MPIVLHPCTALYPPYSSSPFSSPSVAGAPTEPGEVVRIVLSRSQHLVSLPSAYFIRASGDADNLEPTQPDVPVYRETLRRMEPVDIVRTIDGLTPRTTRQ